MTIDRPGEGRWDTAHVAVRAVAIAAAAGWFVVNAHYQHRLAQLWGGGTLSSWDEQRFPLRARSLSARALWRYFLDEGTTTYTHVSFRAELQQMQHREGCAQAA